MRLSKRECLSCIAFAVLQIDQPKSDKDELLDFALDQYCEHEDGKQETGNKLQRLQTEYGMALLYATARETATYYSLKEEAYQEAVRLLLGQHQQLGERQQQLLQALAQDLKVDADRAEELERLAGGMNVNTLLDALQSEEHRAFPLSDKEALYAFLWFAGRFMHMNAGRRKMLSELTEILMPTEALQTCEERIRPLAHYSLGALWNTISAPLRSMSWRRKAFEQLSSLTESCEASNFDRYVCSTIGQQMDLDEGVMAEIMHRATFKHLRLKAKENPGTQDSGLFDFLHAFFLSDRWPIGNLPKEHVIYSSFKGKNLSFSCVARYRKSAEQYIFYSLFPHTVPTDKLHALMEFTTMANYGNVVGNFELDLTDGELRFKSSIDFEGTEPNYFLIKNMVYTNVMTMDEYSRGIMEILFGNRTPAQVIEDIEG